MALKSPFPCLLSYAVTPLHVRDFWILDCSDELREIMWDPRSQIHTSTRLPPR